jgi:hypothetical protein
MSQSNQAQAKKYLAEPTESLWKWTANEDGVQWINGQTIAFVDEIRSVLQHQTARATRGLPPFGAVLLLIAATRKNWNSDENLQWRSDQLERLITLKSEKLMESVIETLDQIHALAPEHRDSLAAKQALTDVVFETSTRTSVAVANEVLRFLNSGLGESFTDPTGLNVPDVKQVLIEDFQALSRGLSNINADQLSLRRETGAETIPTAELIEIPTDPSPAEIFSELESDSELYSLGRAARQLYSVLSLPQPSFKESVLQQGGVSDIANRGPLDRLLLSELAHDDLTLAVRVAVNEAMYLRRESPAQNQQRQRMIVLDCGLRSWGMPRLIGAAMGLALVVRTDDRVETAIYCANDGQLESVSLSNREEIAKHLKTLRPELDLTGAIPQIDQRIGNGDFECDLVLVTNKATAQSSSLSKAIEHSKLLANAKLSRLFVGSVSHDGETELIEVNRLGRKRVKQLTFDNDRLTENAPARPRNLKTADNLPALFGLPRMPLRLSYGHWTEEFVWPIGSDRINLLTKDGRVLHFHDAKFGGRQLSEQIATSKVWWYSTHSTGGVWSAVIGHEQRGDFHILEHDESSNEIVQRPLDISGRPIGFCSHHEILYVIYPDKVAVVDRDSGFIGKPMSIDPDSWISGRFFKNSQGFFALSIGANGHAPEMERIPLAKTNRELPISMLHIHECETVEGPIIVNAKFGVAYFVGNDKTVAFKTDRTTKNLHRLSVESFDPLSSEICLKTNQSFRYLIVDVVTGKVQERSYPATFMRMRINQLTHRQHQLRRRFPHITVLSDGTLRLASKNQPRLEFKLQNKEILLDATPARDGKHFKKSFQLAQRPDWMRYDLQVARWEDGSEAWLDSRGLLHLRSSNADIPELTITLSHGACSGWCSDGEMFGALFHIGDSAVNKSPDEALQIMKQFGEHVVKSC